MTPYATLLHRGSGAILVLALVAAIGAALLLPGFRIEASTDVLLDQGDPDLAYYNATRAEWGSDEVAIFCLAREDWFTRDAVKLLAEFSAELRRVPHAREVRSILDVPLLRNKATLIGLPKDVRLTEPGCDLAKARAELLGHALALDNLISREGRDIAVIAYLDLPAELLKTEPRWNLLRGAPATAETARELAELEPRYRAALEEAQVRRSAFVAGCRALQGAWTPRVGTIRLSGLPVINVLLVEHVGDDLRHFGAAALGLFVLAFAAIYRRFRWVLPSLLASLLPTLLVMALMATLDLRTTVITSNLPVLIFVVTLPFAVYLIERLRERRAAAPGEDAVASTAGAAADIWRPCLYSALTVVAGFASLGLSGVVPVRVFGLMGSLGVLLALAAVFLVLAAAFRLLPPPPAGAPPSPAAPLRPLVWLSIRAPWVAPLLGAAAFAVSWAGASRLTPETKFMDYFRPSSAIRTGLEHVDATLGGTTPLEIVLEGPGPGYFKTPEGLYLVEWAAKMLREIPETGNVRSLTDFTAEGLKAIPIAKQGDILKLLEAYAPRDLRELVSADYSRARILARMREAAPGLDRRRILERLASKEMLGRPAFAHLKEKRLTGVFVLYSNMLQSLVRSHRETFSIVLAAIFVMLLVLFRDPLLALLVLLPQVLPVLGVLGVMGFAGVPLDLATVMIASVAMGIGIDAAIQYAFRYRAELAAAGDRAEAVRRSHATIGRAILIANGIMFAGFLVLTLSAFVPTAWFGLFTGLAMLTGLLGSLTLLPSLFVLLRYPRLPRKGSPSTDAAKAP